MVLNGASPRIENCYFLDNLTECGRGGALAVDRRSSPRVAGCVFANNRAGLVDPMRSSDGGAISWFDWSGGSLGDCVVVANEALTRNDAGGVFIALWAAPAFSGNVVVGNSSGDDAGGLFIGGQEHRYDAPLDPYPGAGEFNVVVADNLFAGNANSTRNSGAMRITMESRVRLAGNVIAENAGGMYLQRSEVRAERNTVWQDWRFVEDKPSLGPSRFSGNILKGPVAAVEARVTFERNMVEPGVAGSDGIAVADVFLEDGLEGRLQGARFDPVTLTTVLTTVDPLPAADYSGRAVAIGGTRGGGQWRVIKRAAGNTIELWGRLEATTGGHGRFEVLRTFTLRPDAPSGVGAGAR
jgi:hypothetical protein